MFRALRVELSDGAEGSDAAAASRLVELGDDDLGPGDVVVDVEYSGVNFKDALALAGRPGVVRRHPLVAGIDLVGRVAASDSPDWAVGDRVLVNGHGIGETHHGGLAERARVESGWLTAVPDGMTSLHAAAIGTAGFTAMLAVLALERHAAGSSRAESGGSTGAVSASDAGHPAPPDGDVLVTGAAGGVGSVAIALLARLGYRVVASTGRVEEEPYLRRLGAAEVIDRAGLGETAGKPLQSQRWAAAVDSVGSTTLANVLAQTRYGGVVAACGLAQGPDLPATVMPFILRAVTLAGINSVEAPAALRDEAWRRLAADLDPALLDGMTQTVPLADAPSVAERVLAGRVRGRTVVDVRA